MGRFIARSKRDNSLQDCRKYNNGIPAQELCARWPPAHADEHGCNIAVVQAVQLSSRTITNMEGEIQKIGAITKVIEARKLAERTGTSTGNISAMVQTIHTVIQTAVSSMGQAVVEVEQGIAMTRENVDGLHQIMKASKQVTDGAQHIASASKEQSLASEDVATTAN